MSNLPSQKDAIAAALALYPARPFAVSDIGSQSGWLRAGGHDPRNLYVSGPMGLATSVALGLAACRPNAQVLAIAGDGALAMNLTSLATIAGAKPKNLSILLVDNRVYEFTASVPSPTRELDWLAVGRAFFGADQCLRLSDLTSERWAGVARPAIIAGVMPSAGDDQDRVFEGVEGLAEAVRRIHPEGSRSDRLEGWDVPVVLAASQRLPGGSQGPPD